jgi:anti-sigma B factor antagonist
VREGEGLRPLPSLRFQAWLTNTLRLATSGDTLWVGKRPPARESANLHRPLGEATERSDHAGDLLDGSGPPPGPVTIEIVSATAAVVTLGGDHDVSSLDSIEDAFRVAGAGRDLLVDLSGCTFIDSTIIKLLLRTMRVLEATGARFELVIDPTPSGHVARVAALMGIGEVISTHDNRRDGIRSLSAAADA